jgi:hypothetical protein
LEFAQNDGTRRIELPHHCGILGWTEVAVDRHAGSRRHTLCPAQVLYRDRHAMQRPTDFATHDFGLGRASLYQRCLGHHVGVALEHAVGLLDPRELRCCGLHRGNLARVDAAGQFGELKIVEG